MKMRNRCPDCGIRYTSELELALHECAPVELRPGGDVPGGQTVEVPAGTVLKSAES